MRLTSALMQLASEIDQLETRIAGPQSVLRQLQDQYSLRSITQRLWDMGVDAEEYARGDGRLRSAYKEYEQALGQALTHWRKPQAELFMDTLRRAETRLFQEADPISRGRSFGWLSASQIDDEIIRLRAPGRTTLDALRELVDRVPVDGAVYIHDKPYYRLRSRYFKGPDHKQYMTDGLISLIEDSSPVNLSFEDADGRLFAAARY